MQTKSTHSWLWYAFYSPQIFKVESFLWSGSMLLSALRCCCSLPWQAQLLALCSFRKLLTFQEEKETQEWLLGKAWDCREGALISPWENTLVFLSFFFVACLCGEPEGDEPNDGYMKTEHKLRSLNCSLCCLAWLITTICRFCALFLGPDSVSKNLMVGEGGRNTTQRSLMFWGELAHTLLIFFFVCVPHIYFSGKERWLVHFLKGFSMWMTDAEMTGRTIKP